jgi:hypothetical protein
MHLLLLNTFPISLRKTDVAYDIIISISLFASITSELVDQQSIKLFMKLFHKRLYEEHDIKKHPPSYFLTSIHQRYKYSGANTF